MKECKYRMTLRKKDRGCIEHACQHFVSIPMKNKTTGVISDQFMCSDLAEFQVGYDTGQALYELGAAVESFRNEMVRINNHAANQILQKVVEIEDAERHGSRLIDGSVGPKNECQSEE